MALRGLHLALALSLSGCGLIMGGLHRHGMAEAGDLGTQVKTIRENTTPKGHLDLEPGDTRMGHVPRAALTSGSEIEAKAFSAVSPEPVVLLGSTPEDICFHFHFFANRNWLTLADVDRRMEHARSLRFHVAAHTSLAEIEQSKVWPAPNVPHTEIKNVIVTVEAGEMHTDIEGETTKRSGNRHVNFDMCMPAPKITADAKYLTVIALSPTKDEDNRVLIWELTE